MDVDNINNSRLERENLALKRRVEVLESQMADLLQAFKAEVDNTTQHITTIHQFLRDIHDYLMPVVDKVFPGFSATKKQIDKFMAKSTSPNVKKSS